MRFRLVIILVFTVLCLALTGFGQSLRILQTTDLHGHFEGVGEEDAGWLRLATLINKKGAEAGERNTLLIDCGDTIQGSFTSAHSQGMIAVAMLQHLRYDVWAPGNHELDFGVEQMARLTDRAGAMVVNGNLRLIRAGYERQFPAFRVFDRGGLRVAVIGANSGYLDNWHWGEHVTGWQVESAVSMLERELQRLSMIPGLDLIVLAIHQGWQPNDPRGVNEVVEIARRFPEIDLILGGHTHREFPGRRIGPRTWYVQAGAHGRHLGVVDVDFDARSRTVRNSTSYLLEVEPTTPRCARAEAALAAWLEPARQAAAETVGLLAAPVTARGRLGRSSRTSELLSRAIAAASQAEVVIHGRLSGADLEAGPVSRADVFRLVPYENKIGILNLTRSELVKIIDEQMAMRRSYAAGGVYGLFVDLDENERVSGLFDRDGAPLPSDDRLYRTAFNSYTLAGGGGRFPVLRQLAERAEHEGWSESTGIWTRDAVVDYLRANPELIVEPVRWLR